MNQRIIVVVTLILACASAAYADSRWSARVSAGTTRALFEGAPTTVDAKDLAALHLEVTGEG